MLARVNVLGELLQCILWRARQLHTQNTAACWGWKIIITNIIMYMDIGISLHTVEPSKVTLHSLSYQLYVVIHNFVIRNPRSNKGIY